VHDDILADQKNKVFVSKDYNEKLLVNLTKFNANYDYNDQDHGYEVRREGKLKVVVIGWTQLGRVN
jgi:ribosome-interacting GTPase 1